MRLFEFDEPDFSSQSSTQDVEMQGIANLISVLNVLINNKKDNGDSNLSVSTTKLINMVDSTGAHFNYASLVHAYETNTAVNKLIKSISSDTVELVGSSEDKLGFKDDTGPDSAEAISRIANRVAKRNIG